MYICLHMFLYVYTNIYICIHMYIYGYTYVYICIYMDIYVYICLLYICRHIYMHLNVIISVKNINMFKYMLIYFTYIYVSLFLHVCICQYIGIFECIYKYIYM